jgi:hypothetical protein
MWLPFFFLPEVSGLLPQIPEPHSEHSPHRLTEKIPFLKKLCDYVPMWLPFFFLPEVRHLHPQIPKPPSEPSPHRSTEKYLAQKKLCDPMCLCGYTFFSFQKSAAYSPKFLNHLANLVHIDQRKNTLPKKKLCDPMFLYGYPHFFFPKVRPLTT